MDISDPYTLISAGHRLSGSGALVTTAACAVPEPDLGFPAALVTGGIGTLATEAVGLADRLTETGDDLAFTARVFMACDGRVGSMFEQVLLGGRFT